MPNKARAAIAEGLTRTFIDGVSQPRFLVIKQPKMGKHGFVTFVMVVEAASAKAAVAKAKADNSFFDDEDGRSDVYSKATAKPLVIGTLYRL